MLAHAIAGVRISKISKKYISIFSSFYSDLT